MGVSPNFQSTPSRPTSEQDLLEDLIIESIGIVGTDVYYLPRGSLSTPDSLYGEDPVSVFDKAYRMPMYLNSFLGPSGPSEIFGKFGMAISDSHRYILARRTFQKWVPQDVRTRPMEGDLIYIPAFTDVVEVKFVEQEHKFYPLARRAPLFYYYELSVESFKFSNEKFRTGFAEIDGIFLNYSYTLVLSLSSTSNTNLNFSVGETVWQANTGFTANVKAWDATTQTLQIVDTTGLLANTQTIQGNTSNAHYIVSSFDYRDFSGVLNQIADNKTAEDEASLVLDLGTGNPFGLPL